MPYTDQTAARSEGSRKLHVFLCVLGALFVLCCMNSAFCMRSYIKTGSLSNSMKASRLSDASIPFWGNVAEQVKKDYVTDEKVSLEDVTAAVDELKLPDFLSGKLAAYGALLSGKSDAVVKITADEVVALVENAEDALYSKCLLVVEQGDKDEIRKVSAAVTDSLNSAAETAYGSRFGRGIARFSVSMWNVLLCAVLLVMLCLRWCKLCEQSGKNRSDALRGMGRVFLIPMCLTLVFLVIGGFSTLIAKDGVIGLHPFLKALRTPLWWITIFELALGFFLTSLAKYRDAKAAAPARFSSAQRPVKNRSGYARMGRVEAPQKTAPQRTAPQRAEVPAPAPAPAPVPVPAAEEKQPCVSCGRMIGANAVFCIYCGTNQNTPPAVPDVPETPVTPEEPAADGSE